MEQTVSFCSEVTQGAAQRLLSGAFGSVLRRAKGSHRIRRALNVCVTSRPFMKNTILIVLLLAVCTPAHAGWLDFLGLGKTATNQTGTAGSVVTLSEQQVVQGLKEALGKGLQQAVTRLGQNGGFLTNSSVRIPFPEKLRTVEKTLRTLKQDKLADDFVATMNHAAEQAVPQAAPVFSDAIRSMSMDNAKAILLGTNNAATDYFRRTTETNLFVKFLPIVKQATSQAGVTSAYKRLTDQVQGANTFGSLGRTLLGTESVDLDSYVTGKSLDGLFTMIAKEENQIRADPAARTSELLQKVFGAVAK